MTNEESREPFRGEEGEDLTRRDLLRGAVYASPVVLTLAATPAFASSGSQRKHRRRKRRRRR